ncbi:hypothetical protein N9M50_04170 [Alphaproteobacteria bacterium]|nr:hypothetical protein [Alphaproteobacteria bacterium]
MKSNDLAVFGKLMGLLVDMERDLGLSALSDPERRVLGAITAVTTDAQDTINSKDIKTAPICKDLADATYYRALKGLTDSGFISVIEGRKTGIYKLNVDA